MPCNCTQLFRAWMTVLFYHIYNQTVISELKNWKLVFETFEQNCFIFIKNITIDIFGKRCKHTCPTRTNLLNFKGGEEAVIQGIIIHIVVVQYQLCKVLAPLFINRVYVYMTNTGRILLSAI